MSATWSKDELQRIAETDDLHISPFREDGKAYGTPTWIWSVVVDGQLYVRSYHGQSGRVSADARAATVKVIRRDESNSKGD